MINVLEQLGFKVAFNINIYFAIEQFTGNDTTAGLRGVCDNTISV